MTAIEAEVNEILPDVPGQVIWIGPQNLPRLIDGIEIGDVPARAIVLQGVLGRFERPAQVLRQLAPYLGGAGWVIAVTAPRTNPRGQVGFTRAMIRQIFEHAGYDVAASSVVRDPRLSWTAEEEATSTAIVTAGRIPLEGAPLCSVVTATQRPEGEHRSRAWNRAVRMAGGRYLGFLEDEREADTGWFRRLVGELQARTDAGAAGMQAVAFGPDSLPCHQLPYPVEHQTAGAVSAVGGRGMVVERALFVDSGGFDPRLGAPFDGPDLCLRLRARGRTVIHVPGGDEKPEPNRAMVADGVRYFIFKWRGQIPDEGVPGSRASSRRSKETAPIVWSGPLLQRSGYGEEARSFVLALDQAGVAVQANPTDWQVEAMLPGREVRRLGALAVREAPKRFINIVHSFPAARMMRAGSRTVHPLLEHFQPHPRAVRNIGRTMYETDRIPDEWVASCNRMDEVWVPADFNVETFSRAGVAPEKLFRVPGAIDVGRFDPRVRPAAVPGARGFVFLSIFAWSLRKGWDVLVRAYTDEFDHGEDVTLVLKVLPHWNSTLAQHRADLASFMRDVLGRDPRDNPRVLVLPADIPADELPGLYRAANAFVLASRGEGYGRPYLEALAVGLPIIGTRWGGNLDFMTDDNSYLVDCAVVDVPEAGIRETPDYRGHRWAEPKLDSLRQAMRHVFEDRKESARRAADGRQVVLDRHSWKPVAQAVVERLREGGVRPLRKRVPDRIPIRLEGPYRIAFGMAEVNRELGAALARLPHVTLELSESVESQPWLWGAAPEVTIRHQWPPVFDKPVIGRWVVCQPWEFGSLPKAWIEPMNHAVDEVWVPSSYVRDCFIRSGVDSAKVAVVPNGVDPERFHPEVAPMPLPTSKRHRFLFVGGTIARKGADILLETYLATFTAQDDVCLVIKDLGSSSFYRGQGLSERIRAVVGDPSLAEVVYLEHEIPEQEMPGLFAACQTLVHPYRGEGFGLPIAEAMACGLAVVVPRHGACLDYCDDEVAYLVEAREVRLPNAHVGPLATVEPGWWAEMDRGALAVAMRRVTELPEEAREVGRRASERIRSDWTWARAAAVAESRIRALTGGNGKSPRRA